MTKTSTCPEANLGERRLAAENAALSERLQRLAPVLAGIVRDLAAARRENASLRRENLRLRALLATGSEDVADARIRVHAMADDACSPRRVALLR